MGAEARRILERCDALAAHSEEPGRLTRRFATPALDAAMRTVEGWMAGAGLDVRRDAAGNLVGRREGAGGTLLLGSHLDSVRDAGRYDGPLGVLVALAAVERLGGRESPFAVEVVGFSDEEGIRYGTAYLGSGVLAGRFDRGWLARTDAEGTPLADALRAFGGDPDGIAGAARAPGSLLAWIEVHIEQGPVLEARGLPVGVVSAIQGATRATVSFEGAAGHAGTVPMEARRDALCAAAEWVLAVEACGRERPGLVATVGELRVEPGASNVICRRAALSLDVRHADDDARRAAVATLRKRGGEIAERRDVALAWDDVQDLAAVRCSSWLREVLADAVAGVGVPAIELASGAGHDAVALSAVCPVGMLFVRCAGGVSHDPAESVAEDDVQVALDVLGGAIERLAR